MIGRVIALAVALLIAGLNPLIAAPFRMHCTLAGKPMADWRERAGQYRIKLKGEKWQAVPDDEAAPLMVLLWAGGAKCVRR